MVATRQSHQLTKPSDFASRIELLALTEDKHTLLEQAHQLCLHCDDAKRENTAIEMVEILAELNLDADSLATAFLTPYFLAEKISIETVTDKLGNHVALLLTGVSQMATISTLAHQGKGTVQIDNIRRMLLAMVEDVRAVVIKLAEQVCHLRDVKDASEEERVIAAKETRDIFAPLANRLGIGQLKWELEDLSFRYLHPDTYKNIAKQLDDKRLAREAYMENMVALVKARLAEAGIEPLEDVSSSRKLIFDTTVDSIKLIIIRATDVPSYVQYGGADIGVTGKDVLMEHGADGLYEPLDLNIARCKLMTAGKQGVSTPSGRLRCSSESFSFTLVITSLAFSPNRITITPPVASPSPLNSEIPRLI